MRNLYLVLFVFLSQVVYSQTWHQLFRENGLPPVSVTGICSDNSGNVYIGTQTSGAYKYDGTGFTAITGLLSNYIRAIECDSTDRVWIGSAPGLSCWDNGIVTNYNSQNGMQIQGVYSLASGSGNVMWIGTGNGLLRFDGMSFIQYTTSDGLPDNFIRALDFDGTCLWIGTPSGLSKFDGSTFTNYTTSNGLPDNNIKFVHCVSSGEIWSGTDNGAAMFNGSAFSVFNTSSGLPSNSIKGITSDINGTVWFSTLLGISRKESTGLTNFSVYNFLPAADNLATLTIGMVYSDNNDIYVATNLDCYRTRIWAVNTMQDTYIETTKVKLRVSDYFGIVNRDTNNIEWGGLEFPIGSGKGTVFTSDLWLGGMDPSNNLLLAGSLWFDSDFFPGPGPGSDNPSDAYDSLYNRLWKVTKQEIDYHILNWDQPGYQVPEAIKNWPSLYSEYKDVNSNYTYEPDLGEYPEIRGDVSVLKLINDNRYNHLTGGNKLKFTAAILYYAYDTTIEALEHTIFVNLNVTNNNIFPVTNLYLGIQSDLDIGHWGDDYIGCDSSLSCYYAYNGSSHDIVYGDSIPAQGIVFMSSPMYTCTYYSESANNVMNNPQIPEDYYYNLRGFWKDGTPYTYGGNGYGGTNATRYVFSGDPVTGTGWSEVGESNTPGGRMAVGSIGPFFIDPGKSKCIDFAYVTGMDSSGNYLLSINKMKQYVTEVIQLYNLSSFYCDTIHVSIPTDVDIDCDSVNACVSIPVEIHPSVSGYYWPMTYTWSPATGLSDNTIVNPVATVDTTTTYYVTVTDAHGNTDTDSVLVIITTPQLTLDSLYEMCEGERLILPLYSWYQWSFGNWTGCWYDFYFSGNYWVRVRNQYGCWSDTVFFAVNITPAPDPELGATETLCIGETITLSPGAGFISYIWNNGSVSDSLFVNSSLLIHGNYLYSVTVTNASGCTASDWVVVKILDCVSAENAGWTQPGTAYPNPFDDYIRIETGEGETGPYTLELFDALGRKVAENTTYRPEISVSEISPGFYNLRFKSGKTTATYRLVKTE